MGEGGGERGGGMKEEAEGEHKQCSMQTMSLKCNCIS